jgi:HEPN domain-containing protein
MDKFQYWIDLAEYDIETAKVMLQSGRYLYVGFMCHQTIEKMLKAYYVKTKNEQPPRTHNLRILANNSGIHLEMSEFQLDFLNLLEPLNIEARYPTDKERIMRSLNQDRCAKIVGETMEMMKWIKSK